MKGFTSARGLVKVLLEPWQETSPFPAPHAHQPIPVLLWDGQWWPLALVLGVSQVSWFGGR